MKKLKQGRLIGRWGCELEEGLVSGEAFMRREHLSSENKKAPVTFRAGEKSPTHRERPVQRLWDTNQMGLLGEEKGQVWLAHRKLGKERRRRRGQRSWSGWSMQAPVRNLDVILRTQKTEGRNGILWGVTDSDLHYKSHRLLSGETAGGYECPQADRRLCNGDGVVLDGRRTVKTDGNRQKSW